VTRGRLRRRLGPRPLKGCNDGLHQRQRAAQVRVRSLPPRRASGAARSTRCRREARTWVAAWVREPRRSTAARPSGTAGVRVSMGRVSAVHRGCCTRWCRSRLALAVLARRGMRGRGLHRGDRGARARQTLSRRSSVEANDPRARTRRATIENAHSIWLSHDACLGVKSRVHRGCSSNHSSTSGVQCADWLSITMWPLPSGYEVSIASSRVMNSSVRQSVPWRTYSNSRRTGDPRVIGRSGYRRSSACMPVFSSTQTTC
jgi:hypothetical protein